MASKRALQLLPLRAPSALLFRAQCPALQRRGIQRATMKRSFAPSLMLAVQRRWHSAPPESHKNKLYEFEDIAKLIADVDPAAILIDVREPHEYAANAIPTALNVPITSHPDALLLPPEEFEDQFGFAKPPVSREVVFYCKAGVRSSAAAAIARHAGYEKVGEYRGSWLDWKRKGGITTKGGDSGEGRKSKGEIGAEESVRGEVDRKDWGKQE